MSIATEIEDLNTNLTAAKSAVTAKGGTVGDTGLAGLAEEIASISCGAVNILTVDDYNYPANNPECVALWLLDDGLYGVASGVDVLVSTSRPRSQEQALFAVNELSGIATITVLNGSPDEKMATYVVDKATGTEYESSWVLRNTMVIDSLTSTDTSSPLSANQGKVLNGKIDGRIKTGSGAPTTATVGTVGLLYEDTTNGKLYQCTAIVPGTDPDPDTYTWGKVGDDGGVHILTVDDYNYVDPDSGEDFIALWLLADGFYRVSTAVRRRVMVSASRLLDYEMQALLAVTTIYDGIYKEIDFLNHTSVSPSIYVDFATTGVEAIASRLATEVDVQRVIIYGGVAPTTSTVGTIGQLYEDTLNGKLYQCVAANTSSTPAVYTWRELANVEQLNLKQNKPVTVWEVDGTVVTTGLVGVNEDISANPNWQLTNLNLTPYKRIKIFSKAAQKAGTTASASTTPAMVLEMSLDPRAAIAEYGGNYVGSMLAQKPNDANRLCTLTCAVSADKTKFEVLRMTSLYGTAATSNSDVNAYVFKIEGYYE